jgi:hypothetical protein
MSARACAACGKAEQQSDQLVVVAEEADWGYLLIRIKVRNSKGQLL